MLRFSFLALTLMTATCHGLSQGQISRRKVFVTGTSGVVSSVSAIVVSIDSAYAAGPDLSFRTSASGIQWADAKVGSGNPLQPGGTATIDYAMSTTGARYGTKIYSTADKDTPYRWKLGDGTTIAGIEKAILGDGDSMPPMKPGGIRRLVIPQSLGYTKLAEAPKTLCVQDGTPGPIPPPNQAFEEYQRFKNIYCNPDRQYQPDLVLDVKLYGSR
ncbi:FKBP-type peptidyl-prolyl cis-trans isomerase [Nitzschia inconspicua]|uniref:peptidylprolyl isomerase n=1 Tax=Nitzschia inconspicua TaxID=303405 RepID=A0A9K3PU49_9STRA|nr:FKBP-type peptidyl-prolyl cis-trans isomerase [Nitzschia inconspicua]